MASVEHRINPRTGKMEHRARWWNPPGVKPKQGSSKWYRVERDAKRHAAQVETDLHRGVYIDPNNTTTVAEYARQWIDNRPYRKGSRVQREQMLRLHIEGTTLGNRPLVKVQPSEIQAWATGRAQIIGPRSVYHLVGLLRSIFQAAVLDKVRPENPVQPKRLALPKLNDRKIVPLTVEQVQMLADTMRDPSRRAMVIVQAGLGLRPGELLALRRQDVDFVNGMVHVEDQLETDTLQRVDPKTPKGRRDIPMPRMVRQTLAEHMVRYRPDDDGLIFTMPSSPYVGRARAVAAGRGITHETYGRDLRLAAQQAGLPRTSPMSLRHHYASVLLQAGRSVHEVAERLGHTNPGLVIKTYGHLMPNQEDGTRGALDDAWKGAKHQRDVGS